MAKQHKVFEVIIKSPLDEKLRDRDIRSNGQRGVMTYKLPIRARYIIEARGPVTAENKALAMAGADGIAGAIVSGWRRLDITTPGMDIFDELNP